MPNFVLINFNLTQSSLVFTFVFTTFAPHLRKVGRVIECARLEIWYTHYVVSGV